VIENASRRTCRPAQTAAVLSGMLRRTTATATPPEVAATGTISPERLHVTVSLVDPAAHGLLRTALDPQVLHRVHETPLP
jgi:hypothetical protein